MYEIQNETILSVMVNLQSQIVDWTGKIEFLTVCYSV